MTISLGCDHKGFPMKATVIEGLRRAGHEIIDHGCHDEGSVDFPDVAGRVCEAIRSGAAARGVMLCGSGVGAAWERASPATKYRAYAPPVATTFIPPIRRWSMTMCRWLA